MTRRNCNSNKIHAIFIAICLVIICIGRYRKAIRAIESSSFYEEDRSFHPPTTGSHNNNRPKQKQKIIRKATSQHKQPQQQSQFGNEDDDYPPPRQIINPLGGSNGISGKQSKDSHMQKIKQQQQALITSSRMKSIQQFKKSSGLIRSDAYNNNINEGKKQPYYDIVNGKKTLVYKRLYPRVLYFVHIHKSAGTLICHYAYRNRLSANHQNNCNVQDDQRCCGNVDTIQAQVHFANTTYFDFVATEREMYDSMAPDHYDYIACIRNSKARYFSHWGHLRRLIPIDAPEERRGGYGTAAWIMNGTTIEEDEVDRFVARLPGKRSRSRYMAEKNTKKMTTTSISMASSLSSFLFGGGNHKEDDNKGRDPLGDFQTWYEHQPDNWNTRVFCGPKCMSSAKYQISRDLFQYVLQRLDNFRHFLFVENMTASINQMANYYGWQQKQQQNESITKNRRHDHLVAAQQLANQSWDFKMSALDDAIYEFARRKYSNVTRKEELWKNFTNQDDLERYFNEGPVNGCTNACCGQCSLY